MNNTVQFYYINIINICLVDYYEQIEININC